MQTKRVICPNCNAILNVKNTKGESERHISCPSCGTKLQVNFPKQDEPIEAHTYIAPQKKHLVDEGETQIGAIPVKGRPSSVSSSEATQLQSPVRQTQKADIIFGGKVYPLVEGQNIIGRKGNTSKATIQIETDDMYMSRQHAAIVLSTLSDGSLKAVLSNYQNKNTTSIDGQDIESGDEIRLANGNRIKMGRTTLIFKIT